MPITISEERCIRCGICMDECLTGAIYYEENNIPQVNEEDCNECGEFIPMCVTEAIIK